MNKWYTCILHVADHVSPVQVFHTRAGSEAEAAGNAYRWMFDGDGDVEPDDVEVAFVIPGRVEAHASDDSWPTAAKVLAERYAGGDAGEVGNHG